MKPPLCAIARWNSPFGARRGDERGGEIRAGRFAEHRHVAGVAAEGRDVALHPLQRHDGVEHAVVAGDLRLRFRRELGVREEAERAEAVVQRDDDGAFAREAVARVARLGARAAGEAAAVQPDHDGPAVVRRVGRRPDVQIEAVLARRRRGRAFGPPGRALRAARRVLGGRADAGPLRDGLRCAPTIRADGWRRVRYSFEDPDLGARARGAGQRAGVDRHLGRNGGRDARRGR